MHSAIHNPEWGQRLRGRFLEGSPINEMIADLQSEGFAVHPDRQIAYYTYGVDFCVWLFSVKWEATANGEVRELGGDITSSCL